MLMCHISMLGLCPQTLNLHDSLTICRMETMNCTNKNLAHSFLFRLTCLNLYITQITSTNFYLTQKKKSTNFHFPFSYNYNFIAEASEMDSIAYLSLTSKYKSSRGQTKLFCKRSRNATRENLMLFTGTWIK